MLNKTPVSYFLKNTHIGANWRYMIVFYMDAKLKQKLRNTIPCRLEDGNLKGHTNSHLKSYRKTTRCHLAADIIHQGLGKHNISLLICIKESILDLFQYSHFV